MSDFNISTPVYLVTGVLESGKTSFLDFTAKQDYFQIEGTTLLITCEEGEEEYDEKELLKYNTVVEKIEEPEDFTFENLRVLHRKYHPERVLLEYNPLWGVNKLRAMKLPAWMGHFSGDRDRRRQQLSDLPCKYAVSVLRDGAECRYGDLQSL